MTWCVDRIPSCRKAFSDISGNGMKSLKMYLYCVVFFFMFILDISFQFMNKKEYSHSVTKGWIYAAVYDFSFLLELEITSKNNGLAISYWLKIRGDIRYIFLYKLKLFTISKNLDGAITNFYPPLSVKLPKIL